MRMRSVVLLPSAAMWKRLSLLLVVLSCGLSQAHAAERVVRGRILDPGGKGVAGVEVSHAWTADNGSVTALRSTKTAPDGSYRFVLRSLEPVAGLLAYTADRKQAARIELPDTDSQGVVEATLQPCTQLKTRLMAKGGEFYVGRGTGWITLTSAGHPVVRVKPEKGACSVPLPPGKFVFHATSPGDQTIARAVQVDGKQPELDIGMFDLVATDACVQKGALPPPFVWADAVPELPRLLEDQHFPDRWTLCYFWAHR